MAKKYNRTKSPKRRSRFGRKTVILSVLVLVLLIAGGLALRNHYADKPAIPTNGNPTTPTKSYVDLSGPTNQDKQDVDSHKEDLSSTPPTSSDGKKTVTPIITNANQSTVNAYVSGVFEDGGTCTATVTNSSTSQVVTKTSTGFENASYTSCAPINNLGLSSGSWQAVLTYSSGTSSGTSASYSIKVP